ncbi:YqaA family protein [Candidatus Njordibacter sp. Uisw_002]|uniref:YqaA family protein n=1 Tax=Candidatus Njordibacter sp. Uisw_002 TaxID=3230971 RepID=UPI003D549F91
MSWLSLFVFSALAATLLPGGSEVLLVAMLIEQPENGFWLWLIATSGNSLGAYVTFFMGGILALRLQRSKFQSRVKGALKSRIEGMFILSALRVDQLQSYGVWLLLLSWVPIIGDGFCLAAGYLGWPKRLCLSLIVIGKASRYALVWLFMIWA